MIDWKKTTRQSGSFLRGFIPRKKTESSKKPSSIDTEKVKIGLAIFITFITLLVLLTPDILLRGYRWDLGDVTAKEIIAPFKFTVENKAQTEINRKDAELKAPTVLKFDRQTDERILNEIMSVFSTAQKIASRPSIEGISKVRLLTESIGFPISEKSAENLLRYSNYRRLLDTVSMIALSIDSTPILSDETYGLLTKSENIEIWNETTKQLVSLSEFTTYFPKTYSITEFHNSLNKIILKNLPSTEDQPVRLLISEMFSHVLQPNLNRDLAKTTEIKLKLRNNVLAVTTTFQQGEIIAKESSIITPENKWILDELSENPLKYGFSVIFGRAVILLLFGYFTALYLRKYYPKMSQEFHNLAPVCTLVVIIIGIIKFTLWMGADVYLLPLAGFAMLAGILFEIRFALLITTELSVLLGVMLGLDVSHVMIFLVSGSVAAFAVSHIVRRSDLIKAGVQVSLINAIGIGALFLFDNPLFLTRFGDWVGLSGNLLAGIGNGFLSYAITLVFLPMFEWMFNLTTDVKLLEYSDPRAPLLDRLEKEAPGTYQHSLNVGQLAEAAASEVGANSLLCRVGGYYQDIGKLVTPEYFTENHHTEEDRKKHDKLTPHMSCLVIKNHVKYGLEMAEENNLPPPIIDIIAQHHGTTLITYFYKKALEIEDNNGDHEIKDEDFRYPGPKPQTTEAAIVMLADSVDAAVTSITNPTAGSIQQMVRKVVNDKFTDEQLDECDLTLRDLHLITENLVRTILSKHHRRVEYPEPATVGD